MNNWIVAAACCIINLLILGPARLAPLLFVASMERYNTNRVKASFPYVLCYLLRTLSGPAIGLSGGKFGIKAMTLFGCISSFISIGACYFAEDILAVTILWGVLYGFGFGFGTSLLPLVLHQNFDSKNITKANGIALAGSSLGAIILPPLIQASIDEYGLSGSFLITGGLILHCIPACLFLSITNPKNKTFSSERKEPQQNGKLDPSENNNQDKNANNGEQKMHYDKNDVQDISPKYTIYGEHNMNSGLSNAIFKQVPKWVEPSGTPKLLQISVISESSYGSGMLPEPLKHAQNGQQIESNQKDKKRQRSFKSFCIFIDPTFWFIMLSQGAYSFLVMTVWTIILDVVRDKGIPRSFEMYCLMFLPISDMIGRVSLGWVTDKGYLSLINFCVVSFFLLGLFSFFFIWAHSFAMIMLAIFAFNSVSGGLISVFPSIVCEFMDTEHKIMAMSSRMLLMAPLSLATSPLIGYFREQCGSYDGIFYVAGSISIFCCLLSALIPRFSRRSKLWLDNV